MENHHITTKPASELQDIRAPLTYFCSKCGHVFGAMSFEQSQMINIFGCPGVKKITEPIPSPFWVNGELSGPGVDAGHDGLMQDLRTLVQEAEQYSFHDYKNKKYPMPKVALVETLKKIADRVKDGYYDNKTSGL